MFGNLDLMGIRKALVSCKLLCLCVCVCMRKRTHAALWLILLGLNCFSATEILKRIKSQFKSWLE